MGGGQVNGWVDTRIKLLILLFLNLIFFCSDSNEEILILKT